MMIKYISTVIAFLSMGYLLNAQDIDLNAPNEKVLVSIHTGKTIAIKASFDGKHMFSVEDISMELDDGRILGRGFKVKKSSIRSYLKKIVPVLKEKVSEISDVYNELTIEFKGGYALKVRAYDNGVSYRFVTYFKSDITVVAENMLVKFNEGDSAYFQKSPGFHSSYETPYQHKRINDIEKTGLCGFPFLVVPNQGLRVLVTESDLEDYPGLWLKKTADNSFLAAHAPYPVSFTTDESKPYNLGQVKETADFIAKTKGSRSFPWRLFALAETDADLPTNTLVYQMAKPLQIEDPSWIKAGVVTFDWWGRRSVYGVDFKAGVNTATAKYFIDFASEFGFEYFLFDDGWSAQGDITKMHPDLDMEEVMAYARKKNVKIMLWAIWSAFEKDWEGNFDRFEKWGIEGIKFDFMNRDDQVMVQFYHRAAKEAAKRKMVLNFHGAYKPAGLRRAYPNVITREALIEFEYNGWTKHVTPTHDNLLPYLRMVTGPMDYIPYTTNNAQKEDFRNNGDNPMGQGTRAHSMALFVILESPMQMLPDSPSAYLRERECTEFIAEIPTEWDEIKVLEAKIGSYTIVARKNGDDWFIGASTDWEARDFELSFDFLGEGTYEMEFIEDGPNAGTTAIDYVKQMEEVTNLTKKTINLAQGGGWIAKIIKK